MIGMYIASEDWTGAQCFAYSVFYRDNLRKFTLF